MARYALVNQEGKVVNVIIWEKGKNWSPPKNHIAVQSNEAQVGDIYDFEKKTFSTLKG